MVKQRDKRVLFVAEGGNDAARGYYRAEIPTRGLIINGWNSRCASILYEQENGKFNGWRVDDRGENPAPKIIVGHVMLTPEGNPENPTLAWKSNRDIIEQARRNGQIWLSDLDDDIWNIPEWNPDYQNSNGIAGHLKEWTEDVNAGDGLIVSTESIARSAKANGITVPIWVCRNGVETVRDLKRSEHKNFRVAWLGALEYRRPDFEILKEAINEWRKGIHYGQYFFEFWHIGANFEKESIRDIADWYPIPIVERPWVKVRDFVRAISSVDLVVIPAVDCLFNHGRSNIVGLSCMAAGVPFLSSPLAEYAKLSPDCITEDFMNDVIHEYHGKSMLHDPEGLIDSALNYSPRYIAEDYVRVFEECLS